MRLLGVQRILNSSTSLSLPVLLLQFPLALILAFSSRTLWQSRHPLFRLDLAIGLVAGAAVCFALGNLALKLLPFLRHHRQHVTLLTWLFAGMQAKLTAALLQPFIGGQQLTYGWRTVLLPVVWFASLASVTHVLQSRSDYVSTFQHLQQTEATLSELERTSQAKLATERRQLIDTVRQTIEPELQQIASEIRDLGSRVSAAGFKNILKQVDNYSIHTLRKLIDELFAETESPKVATLLTQTSKQLPLLNWRRLTLDPWCTFWIALSVSVAATLPTSGFHDPVTMVAQVVALLLPVFILNYIRQWNPLAQHTQPVLWVILACAIVMGFRLSLPPHSPLLVLRNPPPELAIIMALLYAVSIVLGSLNRYFADSYVTATHAQQQVNAQLELSVHNNEAARLVVRRNVARIMHGPIQGRLAAIRLKLHVVSESSSDTGPFLDDLDIAQILDLLEQISQEVENLGSEISSPPATSLDDALSGLASKWRGIISVSSDVSSDARRALELDNDLTDKLVAACSEAITNASRHGYATRVGVSIRLTTGDRIELIVLDDGRGVSQAVTAGIGLQDIEADGGSWRFEHCHTGAKFRVDFSLPVAVAL